MNGMNNSSQRRQVKNNVCYDIDMIHDTRMEDSRIEECSSGDWKIVFCGEIEWTVRQ